MVLRKIAEANIHWLTIRYSTKTNRPTMLGAISGKFLPWLIVYALQIWISNLKFLIGNGSNSKEQRENIL